MLASLGARRNRLAGTLLPVTRNPARDRTKPDRCARGGRGHGPPPRVFAALEHVWWVSPTYLTKEGFVVTIRGTAQALRTSRKGLSTLLGDRYKMKLGAQSAHNAHFLELLPEKQRAVLDQAIKMGYYDRPRRCTQRAIAEALDIKQATVSEHLQSAESAIIHAFAADH